MCPLESYGSFLDPLEGGVHDRKGQVYRKHVQGGKYFESVCTHYSYLRMILKNCLDKIIFHFEGNAWLTAKKNPKYDPMKAARFMLVSFAI